MRTMLVVMSLMVILLQGGVAMANDSNTDNQEELKAKLTPMQYEVTQENGTEPPFHNEYWNNHAEGIYVDIVSGEPLFSSTDKFDSGTGWPSFTRPINSKDIVEKTDDSLSMERTEVRSAQSQFALGPCFR